MEDSVSVRGSLPICDTSYKVLVLKGNSLKRVLLGFTRVLSQWSNQLQKAPNCPFDLKISTWEILF